MFNLQSEPVVPGENVTYTCTGLPSWITDDGCVIFVWAWPEGASGSWYSASFKDGGSKLEFTVSQEMKGFLLVRCVAGTTEPSWSTPGNDPGRIYNQTDDIACFSGIYTYACASWKEYNPS